MKLLIYIPLILCTYAVSFSQAQNSFALIIVPENSEVKIDNGSSVNISANEPYKLTTVPGEHIIHAKSLDSGTEVIKLIVLEANKQKIVELEFNNEMQAEDIPVLDVADIDVTIPGIVGIAAKQGTYNSNEYENYPKYYYAFEKGDEVIFSIKTRNNSGKNEIKITNYTNDSTLYFNDSFQRLNNINFHVNKRGIYKFEFRSKNALDREANFIIKRKPSSLKTAKFITEIEWKTVADTTFITHDIDGKEVIQPKITFREKPSMKQK